LQEFGKFTSTWGEKPVKKLIKKVAVGKTVLLGEKKLIVSETVKKFPAFFGT
jgi:hypothetical protein